MASTSKCVFCEGLIRVVQAGEMVGGREFEFATSQINVCAPHGKRQMPANIEFNVDIPPYVMPGVEGQWPPEVVQLVKALLGPGHHPAAYDVAQHYVEMLMARTPRTET